jgi:hypothetical protein
MTAFGGEVGRYFPDRNRQILTHSCHYGSTDPLVIVFTTFRLRDEFKMSNDACLRSTCILWMINAIKHDDVFEIEGTQSREASNIDAILIGIRSPLMVGIDATFRTKEMLRCSGVELIDRQSLCARENVNAAKIG